MQNEKEKIYVLIDESVQVDIEKYPKDIRVLAEMLEEFAKKNEWIMFDSYADCLEATAKQCLITDMITEAEFDKVLARYGR